MDGASDVSYNPPARSGRFPACRTETAGRVAFSCVARQGGASAMTWRAVFAFGLVVMIAASIGMAVAAVEHSPGWISHPGAATILRKVWLALAVYAGLIVLVVAGRGHAWDVELRCAAVFGSVAGAVEVVNIALENWASNGAISPAV